MKTMNPFKMVIDSTKTLIHVGIWGFPYGFATLVLVLMCFPLDFLPLQTKKQIQPMKNQ